jgi:DNA mismatch endonuclease (patch repair protein)
MDTFTPNERSRVMRQVRGRDTGPEMVVRRLVHSMGFRYRLHCRELPGNPDLVFPSRRKIIFVHGCFWHGHACRSGRNRPSSNMGYWIPKLERNKARDRANRKQLKRLGWDVLVVWECQLKRAGGIAARILRFLEHSVDG